MTRFSFYPNFFLLVFVFVVGSVISVLRVDVIIIDIDRIVVVIGGGIGG